MCQMCDSVNNLPVWIVPGGQGTALGLERLIRAHRDQANPMDYDTMFGQSAPTIIETQAWQARLAFYQSPTFRAWYITGASAWHDGSMRGRGDLFNWLCLWNTEAGEQQRAELQAAMSVLLHLAQTTQMPGRQATPSRPQVATASTNSSAGGSDRQAIVPPPPVGNPRRVPAQPAVRPSAPTLPAPARNSAGVAPTRPDHPSRMRNAVRGSASTLPAQQLRRPIPDTIESFEEGTGSRPPVVAPPRPALNPAALSESERLATLARGPGSTRTPLTQGEAEMAWRVPSCSANTNILTGANGRQELGVLWEMLGGEPGRVPPNGFVVRNGGAVIRTVAYIENPAQMCF